jgi:hypothetical protein
MNKLGLAAIAVATALLAGCTSDKPPADAPAATATGAGAFGGAATPTAGPAPTAELADGRHPVLLTTVDVPGRKVTFDLVEMYFGEAAVTEYRKDHPGATEGPDNGYYVRNNNPKLRTLPVNAGVVVKVAESLPTDVRVLPFADLPAYNNGHILFWLTVSGGAVTLIEQQWVP